MPLVALRFAVFGLDGRSTDIWKVWTTLGRGKRDVYLTSRRLGAYTKLSLHESGRWHMGFHKGSFDSMFDPQTAPPSRFLGVWAGPQAGQMPICRAAVVHFPCSSPTMTHAKLPKDLVRIPTAPAGQMVEVSVLLVGGPEAPDSWPGRASMNTSLAGRIPIDGGGTVTVVYRDVPMPAASEPRPVNPHYFARMSKKDVATANRMVAWGGGADGSVCFMEAVLEVLEARVA
jgi:hypothetical protein